MKKLIFGKKGDAATSTIEKAFEVVFPFIAFLAVLYLVWSTGSNATAQSYFEATEISNAIDAANTFDGQLRLKLMTISDKFSFKVSRDSISAKLPDSELPVVKNIHIPQNTFLDNRMEIYGSLPLNQIQMLKTENSFAIGGFTGKTLQNHIFKKDQLICPTESEKGAGEVIYTAANKPKDMLEIPIEITGSTRVYFNLTALEALDSEASEKILADLNSVPQSDYYGANLIVEFTAIKSDVSAVRIYTTTDYQTKRMGCVLTTEFSGADRNTDSIIPTLVPSQYTHFDMGTKPKVVIELLYKEQLVDSERPIYPYSTLIAKVVKDSYAQVYNE